MDPIASKWLTVEQAAEVLQVPVRKMRTWIRIGAVKHFRCGGIVRIHPQDLQAFCDSLTLEPTPRTHPHPVIKAHFRSVTAPT